jgi:Putative peptidoglycan binding domain
MSDLSGVSIGATAPEPGRVAQAGDEAGENTAHNSWSEPDPGTEEAGNGAVLDDEGSDTVVPQGTGPNEPGDDRNWLAIGLLVGAVVAALIAAVLLFTRDDSDSEAAGDGGGDQAEVEPVPVVASIQQDLQTLGFYDGPIDGLYSPATVEAVEAFQTEAGLTVDGRYGAETHAAVEEALRAQEAAASQSVVELQEILTDLGWYTGEVDGIYGPGTSIALAEFQAHMGLTPDGIVGPETIAAYQETCQADSASCSRPGATLNFTTSDGVAVTLQLESCESGGEADIELQASSDTATLEADADDGLGTLTYETEEGLREGAIDTVAVGEDGRFTVSGSLATVDGGGEPATFQMAGSCA